ncbi:MAG TPA: aspartyl protease family protein [Thermoanaerobaculia bacterium]|nr:aspartyl protease family protein [Thermoanaerobaculia bacterium]
MRSLSRSFVFGLFLVWAQRAQAADPQEILARAKAASGGAAWDAVRTIHSKVRVETGGMTGTAESWEDVRAGRFVDTYQLASVTGAEGFDGTKSWSQDGTGDVTLSDSGDDTEGAANEAWRRSLSYWYSDRRQGEITDGGERRKGDRTFHVLRILPAGGRPFELWIDAATFLIDRTVEKAAKETRTISFSDYREIAGLLLPFRLHETNGDARFDQLVTYETYEINPQIEAARFEVPRVRTDDFSIADGATSVTIPFDLTNNHIYVDVRVNGRPLRLMLDTGGFNVLTPPTAEAMGLKPEGSFQAHGTGEESESFGVLRVDEVRIGGATVRNQVFYALPFRELDKVEGVPLPGLLGFEVFKRFVVRIDYAERRLTLTLPEAFKEPAGATPVAFTFDEMTPQVEGKLDGVPGKFTIDTGSRSSLDVNRPFAEQHKLFDKPGKKIEALTGWGVGGGSRGMVTRAGLLELGTVRVPAPLASISLQKRGSLTDPYLAGNVGGGILRHFTVTFDYQKQRIWFEPNASSAQEEVWDRSGLWLNRADDGYRIEDVVAESPAAAAGLKVGDLVLSVDGRRATELPLADARAILKGTPGTRVRLQVRSGEAVREVEVVLREMV